MSKLPAMPMYWGDFFSKTSHLSFFVEMVYCKMLGRTWQRNGQPFPAEADAEICRSIGIRLDQWKKVRPQIEPFFDLSDGFWRQPRLEREFKSVLGRVESRRKNGALGGMPKHKKNHETGLANGLARKKQHSSTQNQNQTLSSKDLKGAEVGSADLTGDAAPAPREPPSPEEIAKVEELLHGAAARMRMEPPEPTLEEKQAMIEQWNKELGIE